MGRQHLMKKLVRRVIHVFGIECVGNAPDHSPDAVVIFLRLLDLPIAIEIPAVESYSSVWNVASHRQDWQRTLRRITGAYQTRDFLVEVRVIDAQLTERKIAYSPAQT